MRVLKAFFRQFQIRPRLSISILVGIALLLLLPPTIRGTTRALLAWDLGAGLYLVLAWTMMFRGDVHSVRWRAKQQDDGATVVLALTVVAAVASVAAILLELTGVKSYPPGAQTLRLGLVAVTIMCSWSFVHTAFALHYAHEFYDDAPKEGPQCLQFPGNPEPDYVDFLYFAFVIGTTAQTADVTIASSPMRRLALLHGIIAFLFNTTLLALMVNIAAGLT